MDLGIIQDICSNIGVTFVSKQDTCNVIVHLGKCSSNGGSNWLVHNSLSSLHKKKLTQEYK